MMAAALFALALLAQDPETAPPAPTSEEPPIVRALAAAGLDPKTKVEDGAVQVMFGQRAVVQFGADQKPTLDAVEIGRIDRAAPKDPNAFKGVPPARIAFSLDAAPAERVSIMKVWNGLTTPVAFEAEIVALRHGQLMRKKEALCSVPAGGAAYETWPDPLVAVTISNLSPPASDTPACNTEKN